MSTVLLDPGPASERKTTRPGGDSPWSLAAINRQQVAELGLDRLVNAPSSPAHLAYRVGRGRWAYPTWLQYLNSVLVPFLLSPSEQFLIVEVPVRHGKSAFISSRVPSWYLGMFPDKRVIATSFSDKLVRRFGRANRNLMLEWGPGLFGVSISKGLSSQTDWTLEGHEGGMLAVTRGGQITGEGGDLIIIDDPIKGHREAQSAQLRDDLWDWFQQDLRNRLQPGGKIIIVMSRWHEDDLVARLTTPRADDEFGDRYQRVHLPALAEPAPWELDGDGRLADGSDLADWRDVLGRKHGEALWPEWYNKRRLLNLQAGVGPISFAANFQQRPSTMTGSMFPPSDWRYVDEVPKGLLLVRRWDLADNDGEGDWAAGALLGMDAEGFTYVIDVRRIRKRARDVERWIRATAEEDAAMFGGRARVHHVIEQEPGSTGKTVAGLYVRKHLAGFSAEAKPSNKNKTLAAEPFAGQVQAGNVYLLRAKRPDGHGAAAWWADFKEEARQFPRGGHDDMVDAASKAYTDLVIRLELRRKRRSTARSAASRPASPRR